MDSLIKKYFFSCTPDFNYLNIPYCGSYAATPLFQIGPTISYKYVFTYIKKGKGVYTINNNKYALNAGCSYMIFPGYEYSHESDRDDPWEYCWFEVYGSILDIMLKLAGLTIDHPMHVHTNTEIMDNATKVFFEKYITNSIECELGRVGLIHQIFTEIINDSADPSLITPAPEYTNNNQYISKAINFIANNFSKDISVNEIADYVGLDRSYFCKLFKKVTNKTPSAYLINYQMRSAKYLFMNTSYKIEEIAHLVGYKRADHFSRMFKLVELITPSEYRKQKYTSFSTSLMKYEK